MDWLGPDYPIRLHIERRGNSRISFGKKALNVRISSYLSESEKQVQLEKFLKWAKKIAENKGVPGAKQLRNYWDLEYLNIWGEEVGIRLIPQKRKSVSAEMRLSNLVLKVPGELQPGSHESISTVVSRAIGQHYKPRVERELQRWNEAHIQKPINEVRLKQNHSNWGSCSNKGNINISTRLLQAPDPVIQYVLVHELCHLIHRNHGQRFWAKVEKIMPDYPEAEAWLKRHGSNCYY